VTDRDKNSGPTRESGEIAAVWVDIAELKPWAKNPRLNDAAVPAVAASIKRFGFSSPIIARREDGEIIAGHTRIKAAETLGLTRVPVRYMDLDPADAHLLAIADNKLNEKADWDESLVASILSEFSLDDAALAGFDSNELEKLGSGVLGTPPDEFLSFDEGLPTDHMCPKCGFEFS
jgi:ParB-like chromosome segregation protein Spo0J